MARKATGQVVERETQRGRVYALRFRAYGERLSLVAALNLVRNPSGVHLDYLDHVGANAE